MQFKKIIEKVEVIDTAATGKAVAKHEDKVIFVQDAVPGDIIDIGIVRKKSSYLEGVPVKYHKKSDLRDLPFCEHFGVCGGCKWQNLTYEAQLHFKQKQINDAFYKIARINVKKVLPIIASDDIKYYRNKLEYTFSNKKWLTNDELINRSLSEPTNGLGFHMPGRYDKILDIKNCYLQKDPSNDIRLSIKEYSLKNNMSFYDLVNQKGLLRNLIIRNSTTNEWMIILVFNRGENDDDYPIIEGLLKFVGEKFPGIKSILFVNNSKKNDTIHDLPVHIFKGTDYIIERINHFNFKIGAKSFFQTNTKQAENLYGITLDFAGLHQNETVYDLYTGAGTIAIYVSSYCKNVIGIENVAMAIENANENAQINCVTNATFITGEVEKILEKDFVHAHGIPDVVITDPPRAGMHKDVLKQLLEIAAPRIVYVSCNPATQARDIEILSAMYEIEKMQAVDMFPHTQHVENVVLLIKKL